MNIQRKSCAGIASMLTIGLAFGAAPLANADTMNGNNTYRVATGVPSSIALGQDDTKLLEASIESGFRTLFTEIIYQNNAGVWEVNDGFESKYSDISRDEVERIADSLNNYEKSSKSAIRERGFKEYGMCVLEGLLPFGGFISIDWGNVYIWIKQNSWGKLSKYLAKHAAKLGIKDLASFTPQGLAIKLAVSMVSCAIFE